VSRIVHAILPDCPRILVDCDGVLADFVTPCLEKVFELTGKRFHHDDVKEWEVPIAVGLTPEQSAAVYKAMEVKGLCRNAQAYPGARAALNRMRERGYQVIAVTKPFGGEHWVHERDAWLIAEMGFKKHEIQHARMKEAVVGDVLIEDSGENLRKWTAAMPEGKGVMIPREYNAADAWTGPRKALGPDLIDWIDWELAHRRYG